MIKHVSIFLKRNRFTIKALNIGLFIPAIKKAVYENLIHFIYTNFII